MDQNLINQAFYEASLKIYRAKRHIGEVEFYINSYTESNYCELVEEANPNGGQAFFIQTHNFPASLPLAVGDTLHCLAVVQDYITTGLMRAAGSSTERVGLPSHETRDALEKSFSAPKPGKTAIPNRRVFERLPEFANLLLDTIQPYKGGNYLAWEMRQADNLDKHNIIVPVVAFGTLDGFSLVDEVNHVGMTDFKVSAHAGCRFKLASFGARNNFKIEKQGNPALSVRFPDTVEVFAGDPLLPTLTQCIEFTSEFIRIVARKFGVAEGPNSPLFPLDTPAPNNHLG